MPIRTLVSLILIGSPALTLAADAMYKAETVTVSDMSRPDSQDAKNDVLCGMHVRASTELPSGSSIEWELALSIVTNGQIRVAGISVGSFARQAEGTVRSPRAPVRSLALSIANTTVRTEAKIVGSPNNDNGVRGQISDAVALKLFDALDAREPVTVEATYDSGDHELLSLVASPSKAKSKGPAGHGASAPVYQCLAHLVATTGGQSQDLIEIPHVSQ